MRPVPDEVIHDEPSGLYDLKVDGKWVFATCTQCENPETYTQNHPFRSERHPHSPRCSTRGELSNAWERIQSTVKSEEVSEDDRKDVNRLIGQLRVSVQSELSIRKEAFNTEKARLSEAWPETRERVHSLTTDHQNWETNQKAFLNRVIRAQELNKLELSKLRQTSDGAGTRACAKCFARVNKRHYAKHVEWHEANGHIGLDELHPYAEPKD